MSKGGGSAPQSTVTTQVEKLPVELVPFYKDLLGRGVYESLTGYDDLILLEGLQNLTLTRLALKKPMRIWLWKALLRL